MSVHRLALLAALVPATAIADDEPPFAALARPGVFHVLVLDGTRPRCEAWQVTPASDGHGTIARPDGSELGFTSSGAWITPDGDAPGSGMPLAESGEDGDITVAQARWFATGRACDLARARHDRVATDLARWQPPAQVPTRVAAATRARFEAILGGGGALYALANPDPGAASPAADACRRVAVHARRAGALLSGELLEVTDDDDARTITTRRYEMQRGAEKLTLFPPETRRLAARNEWGGGGSYGCICVDEPALEFSRDAVALDGETYHVSLAACRAARAARQQRATWLP